MRISVLLIPLLVGCGSGSNVSSGTGGEGGNADGTGSAGAASGGEGALASGGGSASEAGGAGASGGGTPLPPIKPGNCGALKPAGTWEKIRSRWSDALVVDPFDPAIVWLADDSRGLLKSTDCGSTWTHVNTGQNGDKVDQGGIVSMAVDPVERGVIYAAAIYGAGGLWKSLNGGVDWQQLFPAGSEGANTIGANVHIDSVSMDPTDHRHLVINPHANCGGAYAPTCGAESKDGGATWHFFRTPPGLDDPSANWEEGAGAWVINATTWVYGGFHLWLTTNNGKDWKNLNPDPAEFWSLNGGEVQTHSIPRGSDGTYYLTAGQGVVRSSDGGLSWSLIPNSGGRKVGFAIGGGKLFASDQWSASYHVADEADATKWTEIAPAPDLPKEQGAPFLDYDAAHHILYSSNYAGGAWRLVMP